MAVKLLKLLEGLGLCEHCGALISAENMPVDSIDAEWRCPKCKGVLSGRTFGYEGEGKETQKARWVGPGSQWVSVKPVKDFELGEWDIVVTYLPVSSMVY